LQFARLVTQSGAFARHLPQDREEYHHTSHKEAHARHRDSHAHQVGIYQN